MISWGPLYFSSFYNPDLCTWDSGSVSFEAQHLCVFGDLVLKAKLATRNCKSWEKYGRHILSFLRLKKKKKTQVLYHNRMF